MKLGQHSHHVRSAYLYSSGQDSEPKMRAWRQGESLASRGMPEYLNNDDRKIKWFKLTSSLHLLYIIFVVSLPSPSPFSISLSHAHNGEDFSILGRQCTQTISPMSPSCMQSVLLFGQVGTTTRPFSQFLAGPASRAQMLESTEFLGPHQPAVHWPAALP
jgi:hypothetical protein